MHVNKELLQIKHYAENGHIWRSLAFGLSNKRGIAGTRNLEKYI